MASPGYGNAGTLWVMEWPTPWQVLCYTVHICTHPHIHTRWYWLILLWKSSCQLFPNEAFWNKRNIQMIPLSNKKLQEVPNVTVCWLLHLEAQIPSPAQGNGFRSRRCHSCAYVTAPARIQSLAWDWTSKGPRCGQKRKKAEKNLNVLCQKWAGGGTQKERVMAERFIAGVFRNPLKLERRTPVRCLNSNQALVSEVQGNTFILWGGCKARYQAETHWNGSPRRSTRDGGCCVAMTVQSAHGLCIKHEGEGNEMLWTLFFIPCV